MGIVVVVGEWWLPSVATWYLILQYDDKLGISNGLNTHEHNFVQTGPLFWRCVCKRCRCKQENTEKKFHIDCLNGWPGLALRPALLSFIWIGRDMYYCTSHISYDILWVTYVDIRDTARTSRLAYPNSHIWTHCCYLMAAASAEQNCC